MNHLCVAYARTGLDLSPRQRAPILLRLLSVLDDYFTANGIEYWLDGGTLLGSFRDGHLIPWDDDADVCLREEGLRRLLAILPTCPLGDPGARFLLRRSPYVHGEPEPPADVIPGLLVDVTSGVFVDLFLCHELNARWLKMYWLGPCHECRASGVRFRRETVFPLGQTSLEGRGFPCPNDSRRYLRSYYGDLRPRRD